MNINMSSGSPTLFGEFEGPSPVVTQDDERALQIALELSNLGLLGTCDDDSSTASYDESTWSKKSQNMTECVPVPSSEHVAEIVGRQGCKIKALRSKTSTYIKTPVRGEEPVFVVTGREEDVALARREIQSAAEHFTQIRATRNRAGVQAAPLPPGLGYPVPMLPGNTSPTDLTSPKTFTLQVRVPYRVVGLVVGPKGATIKRIQQQTHTYIITPSRDKEPVFEVSGLPGNVERAKEEIEAHIAARTGTQCRDIDDDFANNGTVVGSPASIFRPQSAFTPYCANDGMLGQSGQDLFTMPQANNPFATSNYVKYSQAASQQNVLFDLTSSAALNMYNQPGSASQDYFEHRTDNAPLSMGLDTLAQSTPSWGLGDFPNMSFPLFSATSTANSTNDSSMHQQTSLTGPRPSPTLSDAEFSLGQLQSATSMPASLSRGSSIHSLTTSHGINIESGYSSASACNSQTSGSPIENILAPNVSRTASPHRLCVLCQENQVVAALVPCGHNMFCYDCANKAVKTATPCPCCRRVATMALRIKSDLAE